MDLTEKLYQGLLSINNTNTSSSNAGSTKTAYQQNVSTPVATKTNMSDTRGMLGKITNVAQFSTQMASDLLGEFTTLQQTPTSKYYNPYTQATNRSVSNLASLGIDTSKIDDDWFEQTKWLDDYLVYNGTTNTPSSPGKKATAEQNAAYERYQISKANDLTNKAKTEWDALQEEVTFLTKWSDRNYSDDEIVDYIYSHDFSKKYPTLYDMDESLRDGSGKSLLELNEGVDYCRDNLYGVIWAARNGGGTGNVWQNTAWSALGDGNVWLENKTISDRLNPKSDMYSPYMVGSTMDDACMYFNRTSFDDDWLEKNRPDETDKTSVDMWNKVYDAEQFTKKAEEEASKFNQWLDKKLSNAKDPSDVMRLVDSRLEDEYSTLDKMKTSQEKVDSLLDTTRAVNFSYNDIQKRVYEACEKNGWKPDEYQTLEKNGVKIGTEQNKETTKTETNKVSEAGTLLEGTATQTEQNVFENTPSTIFEKAIGGFISAAQNPFTLISNNESATTTSYSNQMVGLSADLSTYMTSKTNLDNLNALNDEYVGKIEQIQDAMKGDSIGMPKFISDLMDGEYIEISNGSYKPNSNYAPALLELYEYVTGLPSVGEDGGIRPEAMDSARVLWECAQTWQPTYEEGEELPWVLPEFSEDKKNLESEVERTAYAQKEYDKQQSMWQARIDLYDTVGLDSTGLRTAQAVSQVLPAFANYQATQWLPYSYFDMAAQDIGEGATFEDVIEGTKEDVQQARDNIETGTFLLKYIRENGVEVPQEYKNNITRYIEQNNRVLRDFEYYEYRGAENFSSEAERGRKLEAEEKIPIESVMQNIRSNQDDYRSQTRYGLDSADLAKTMTDAEKDTYYYLYATQGIEYAAAYYDYLADPTYGILHTRNSQNIDEQAAKDVNGGVLSAIWANAKAIASAPLEMLSGSTYSLYAAVTGTENNPYNDARAMARYSTDVNRETVSAINRELGEGSLLADLATGAYEIAYNRGRSMVMGSTLGAFAQGISNPVISSLAGAAPMAIGAADNEIAGAKEKGAQDWQAYAIGGVALACEDLTEGLTYNNFQEAIHGASGDIASGVKNWLTSSGLEEMIGETTTDFIENIGNDKIMGALSDHNALVDDYISKLELDKDNPADVQYAEELAYKDEMDGLLHTALISYLSPGLDVFTGSIASKINDFHNIRITTRNMQKNGVNVSMLDVAKVYNTWKENAQTSAAQETSQTAETQAQDQQTQQEQQQQAPADAQQATDAQQTAQPAAEEQQAANPETTTEKATTPQKKLSEADQAFLRDLGALDAVEGSDASTQAAALGSLFGAVENTNEGDIAKAAAAAIPNLFGGTMADAISNMKNLLIGSHVTFKGAEIVKQAIKTAALAPKSNAATVVSSAEFQNASPEDQASMLASTVEADQQDASVAEQVAQSTHEYRVAEAEKVLIANGALDSVKVAQEAADKAKENFRMAQESLSEKQATKDAKAEVVRIATQELQQNPTNDNQHALDRALNELAAADAVEQEYEQHLDSIQRANDDAQSKLADVKETAMRDLRNNAEAAVAQVNEQRAQIAEQAAQKAQEEAQAKAEAQAKEDEQTGKAQEDRNNSIIEGIADSEHLEGQEREKRIDELKEQASKVKIRITDLKNSVNNTEGMLAVHAFSRKIGLPIELGDLGPVDGNTIVRGKYVYDEKTGAAKIVLNQNLIKAGKMTVGQALVEASLHEIVHSMRNTGSYENFRKVVMQSVFKASNDVDAMAMYNENADYRAKVDDLIKERKAAGDQNFIGKTLEEQVNAAEDEIVADFARLNLAEKDTVQRFMDAGLGGRIRNALHNINQALKNYFGNLTGEERQTAEYLRRAERAFQKAMIESAKSDIHPNSDSFSVSQIAESMNMGMIVNDDTLELYMPSEDGDIIGEGVGEGKNGLKEGQRYVLIDGVTEGRKIMPDMIVNTPVGMLIDMGLSNEEFTDENGNVRTQQGDARQMFADLMNLCARYKDNNLIWEIAGSEFSEAFSALKSNSDPQYKNTVDFGTICSKTQAVVDVLSQTMLDRAATIRERNETNKQAWIAEHGTEEGFVPEVFTGLTREDIMEVYNRTHNAGLSVPCPVCYVFSRWMGVPGMLGQMNRFQNQYVSLAKDENGNTLHDENGDAVVDWEKTFELSNGYLQDMVREYTKTKDNPNGIDLTDPNLTNEERQAAINAAKEKIAKQKGSINNKIRTRQKAIPKLAEQNGVLQEKLDKQDLTDKQWQKTENQILKNENAIKQKNKEIDQLMEDLKEFEAFNWVSQVVCVQHSEGRATVNDLDENGNFVMDTENFRYTPEEILFDLNRSGEFAGYAKNWRYRTTRGAGMGKAIMPYSGASIGDIIHGDAIRWKQSENPLLNMDRAAATKAWENAKERVKRQNLVGGQRFQSTSDFRPEWGLDYIMSFLEMQALGSKVQMYTKVAEAVDFLGSIGADVNLSIMAKNNGYHIATDEEIKLAEQDTDEGREMKSRMGVTTDENGESHLYVMEFSDVTGMDYDTAKAKTKKFNNVQMILVGMNDIHIRLALGSDDIDFVIPWHSSGNSKDVLQQLVSSVGEALLESSDYTDSQTDQIKSHKEGKGKNEKTIDDRTESEIKLWDARVKLLTEGGDALTEEERRTLLGNDITRELYRRFTEKGYDPDCYNVKLTKDQAEQVFPYEYWDKTSTRENADVNGQRFVAYCDALGLVPRFSQFKDVSGYWKLLIDRKMYDNNVLNEDGTVKEYGKYREQKVVDVTKARMDNDPNEALDEATKRKKDVYQLPETTTARYGRKNYSEQTEAAIRASGEYLSEKYDVKEQQSTLGDLTEADLDLMSDADTEYQDAVSRGDMEAAQRYVDSAAEKNGYTEEAFHGTRAKFNSFDINKSSFGNSGYGFYFGNRSRAAAFSGEDMNIIHVYINPDRIATREGHNITAEQFQSAIEALGLSPKKTYGEYGRTAEEYVSLSNDWRLAYDLQDWAHWPQWTTESGTQERMPAGEILSILQKTLDMDGMRNDNETVLWDNKLIKSADPVTYDDNGNVIPLSERFNGANPDIRYSTKGEMSAADRDLASNNEQKLNQTLVNSGVLTQDEVDRYNGKQAKSGRVTGMINDTVSYSADDGYIKFGNAPNENVIKNLEIIGMIYNPTSKYWTSNGRRNLTRDVIVKAVEDGNNGIEAKAPGRTDTRGLPEEQPVVRTQAEVMQNEVNAGIAAPLEGMNPLATSAVGPAQRAFGQGMLQDSDEIDSQAKALILAQNGRGIDTNAEQIDRAIQWIRSGKQTPNSDGLYEAIQKITSGDFDYRSADGQARMVAVMGMAAAKNDTLAQITLADAFNRQGTDLGRALQARKLFRLMTPEGRISSLQKMLQNTQDELNAKGTNKELKFSDWIYRAAAYATEEGDFEKVYHAATQEIASQLPANWKEKLNAFRMLSMLGNPRTHIRNVVGNALFMPAVGLKNKIGATLEAAFVKEGQRTKTIGLADKAARTFAKLDAEKVESDLRGDSKYSEGTKIQQERKMFGQGEGIVSKTFGRLGQALVDFNGDMLEKEDWIFLKRHYQNALAGYMTANKLNSVDMTGKTLENARVYAIEEAKKATYRDANGIATWLNNVKNPVGKFIVNAVLPFKKTPANILKRGVEYSPLGLIRSATTDIKHLQQWNAYQKGELKALPEKAISPSQYIDRVSSGLSGTLVLAAGALLSSLGVVRAGLDDDDDEFDKLRGSQEYSIEIGGVSFTADWAAPMSMPFFVGATVMDEIKKLQNGENISVGDVLDAMIGISEPVFNLSMLDGVNSLMNTNQYSEGNNITQIGEKIITNYFSSYVPTLLGQTARTIDTTRRKNYVESGADLSVFRSAWEQIENKIPWLSQTNIPYRNVWGEADVSPAGWAAIENFISPGYGNTINDDPVTNELQRIYEATGDQNMIPKAAGKTVAIGGQTVRLNAEQYDQYVVDRGQTAKQCLTDLMESPIWQICDDSTRAMMVSDAWTYANQIARHQLDSNGKLDTWVANAQHNGNFVEVVTDRAAESNRKEYISGYGQTMAEALDYNDAEMYELSVTALEEAGASEAEIRAPLRNYFKPLYQHAFETGGDEGEDRMDEIREMLLDADVGFKTKDFDSWIPQEADEDEEKPDNTRWMTNSLRSDMDSSMMPIYQAAMASGDTAKMEQIEQMLLNSGLGYTEKDFEAWKQR